MPNNIGYWRKNADWQLAEMNKLPNDTPGGKWRDKSAHFDEWVGTVAVISRFI
jgi:hypothetical protein